MKKKDLKYQVSDYRREVPDTNISGLSLYTERRGNINRKDLLEQRRNKLEKRIQGEFGQ